MFVPNTDPALRKWKFVMVAGFVADHGLFNFHDRLTPNRNRSANFYISDPIPSQVRDSALNFPDAGRQKTNMFQRPDVN